MKRVIKVGFSDFWPEFKENQNFIMDALTSNYEVIISNEPDYLFYSCFGRQYLKHDCIRIFFIGEDLQPDFNLCDYSIGFSHMVFGERYIRFPLYHIYEQDCLMAEQKHLISDTEIDNKSRFCNFIYSNTKANPFRGMFFDSLNIYKRVDSGGKYKNNLGFRVDNKLDFQRMYKFSIAFENNSSEGYTTEKILQAFAAGTIPIYWGDPRIGEEFNERAFINCHRFETIEAIIDQIKTIDGNDNLLRQMLREPAFVKDRRETKRDLEDFLRNLIDKPYEEAFKRSRHAAGRDYETLQQQMSKIIDNPVLRGSYRILKRIKVILMKRDL
ncbi:MAG: glycosyltransferase family 10 [Eubacteriales bacterium]|nr:glycosyltransferase family 10 [Eubacteriales bacterium]